MSEEAQDLDENVTSSLAPEERQNVGEGGAAKISYWSVPWRSQLKIMDSNLSPSEADGGMGRHGHFQGWVAPHCYRRTFLLVNKSGTTQVKQTIPYDRMQNDQRLPVLRG